MADVEKIIWFAIGLLFVLILLVVISTIMASADPNAYIATQNTMKLRDTMNFVCQNGGMQEIKFSLPQSVPYLVELFGGASGFITTRNGDPYYTLYYEAFPPGDAIGWESYYHATDAKAVAYLPQNYDVAGKKTIADAEKFFGEAKRDVDANLGILEKPTFAEMIILGNVILTEDFPHYMNYKQGPFVRDPTSTKDRLITEFFNFGEWIYKDPVTKKAEGGDNYFDFGNYNSLSAQEKSAIKYIPCGDNSLCLKTRRNVYRYELDRCGDIEHVVFAYDSTTLSENYGGTIPTAVGTGAVARSIILRSPGEILTYTGRVAKWIVSRPIAIVLAGYDAAKLGHYFYTAFLAYKSSDFSIASPCEADMTIQEVDCSAIPNEYKCSSYQKAELYKYSEQEGVKSTGKYHYICNDKIQNAPDGEQLTGKCLFVNVSKTPKGYCWTADPYKNIAAFAALDDANTPMSAFASSLGLTPVRDHTSSVQGAFGQATILMPFDAEKEGWKEKLSSKISWRWPIDKSDESVISDLVETFTS